MTIISKKKLYNINLLPRLSFSDLAVRYCRGMTPFTFRSGGSVRILTALCGLHGYQPVHAALPIAGADTFVDSFDDIGPFAQLNT